MTMTMSAVNYIKIWEDEFGINVCDLTSREREILGYIARGCLNKQIARSINITEQTTKNHITNIFRKLGASNRTEAVIKAIRMGVVQINSLGN